MTNKDKDQVLIPMVTTIEAALDYGFSMKDTDADSGVCER